jgi:hypothetical protein
LPPPITPSAGERFPELVGGGVAVADDRVIARIDGTAVAVPDLDARDLLARRCTSSSFSRASWFTTHAETVGLRKALIRPAIAR